jgi:F0F1-type ATP synthase epsilon subunit
VIPFRSNAPNAPSARTVTVAAPTHSVTLLASSQEDLRKQQAEDAKKAAEEAEKLMAEAEEARKAAAVAKDKVSYSLPT